MSYQLFRKFVLPDAENLVEKSFYIVSPQGSSTAELYYVGGDKSVKTFLNEQRVQEMIEGLARQTLYVVETVEDRDTLQLTDDSIVVVLNNSEGQPLAVPELYLFVVSVEEFILLNTAHSHSNLSVLDEIAEDVEGHLTYKGERVASVSLGESQW